MKYKYKSVLSYSQIINLKLYIKIIKMISYEEYKKLNNIENNQYIEFLDITSWKENNRKNRPRTTNNSDTSNYIPPTKLEILS